MIIFYSSDASRQTLEQSLDLSIQHYRQLTYASSTQKTYQTQRQCYLAFCTYMGYAPVPATTTTICRYAALLSKTHKYNSIKQYLNIVRILHLEWGLHNPLDQNYNLNCVLKGIRRDLGDSVNRKLPITPMILLDILKYLSMDNIVHCNVYAASLVMFFGMLRRSNVLPSSKSKFDTRRHLRRQDVSFRPTGVIIKIRWSKTIQFHERELNLPLPRIPGNVLCPTQAVYKCFQMSPNADPSGPAFMIDNNPLTIHRFLQIIQHALTSSGYNSKSFGGHSFRRGGATWAYHCGVPVDSIRQIGDWRSNAYVNYIFETPESINKCISNMAKQLPTT